MTRETIPRFDLYAELEVARTASAETIEAAYRSMAKRHHPDLVSALRRVDAEERIKRINVARDWLTDPERRQRYDRSLRFRDGLGVGATIVEADGEANAHRSPWSSFGPNTERVRQFLGELRDLDEARALQVLDGRASIDADDYAHARRAAFAISRSRRLSEWLFARDAATGVALEQLPGSRLATEVGELLAEVAGAIAVRDLIPAQVFDTLLEPWMWRAQTIPAKTARWTVPVRPRPMSRPEAARAATPPPAPAPTRTAPAASATRASLAPDRAPIARTPSTRGPIGATSARERRAAIGILAGSMTVLIVVATLVGASTLFQPKFTGQVEGIQASSGNEPTLAPVANATPVPTQPSPSSPSTAIAPALLAELQHGAWDTIRRLKLYAIAINVTGAQRLLGDSAPGLRGSGLNRATFPVVLAADIKIARAGTGWKATAGADTLTSKDGEAWTFDYGNRPLARFTSAAVRHLYFLGPTGSQHTLNVTLTSITLSRSTILAAFKWSYGPDTRYGNDGPYFSGDELVVSGLTLSSRSIPVAKGVVAGLGGTTVTAALRIHGESFIPGGVVVDVAVIGPGHGEVDAAFELGG